MKQYFYDLARKAAAIAGSPILAKWIYAQWCHETDGFTSGLCISHFNLGGLTQTEPNDLPQPDGDNYYMDFASFDDCATYFGHYLCLYRVDGIFEADSLKSYLTALHNGGYFTADFGEYLAGCRKWLATIR